jgi:hypothetical protein
MGLAEKKPATDALGSRNEAIAWVERMGMTPVKGGHFSYFDKSQKSSLNVEIASESDDLKRGYGQSESPDSPFNNNYSVVNTSVKRRRSAEPHQPGPEDSFLNSKHLDQLSIFKLGGAVYGVDVSKNVMDFLRSKNINDEAKKTLVDYLKNLGHDPTDVRYILRTNAHQAKIRMETMWKKGFTGQDGKIGVDKVSVAAYAASKNANLNMVDLKPSFKAMVDKTNEKFNIYANPLFVATLTTQAIKAVIAHENYHHTHRHYDLMRKLVKKAAAMGSNLPMERLWEYVNLAADVETNADLEIDRLELDLGVDFNNQSNQDDSKSVQLPPTSDVPPSYGKGILAAASSWGGAVAGGLQGMSVHIITGRAIKQDFNVDVNIEEDSIEDIFFRIIGSDKVKGMP